MRISITRIAIGLLLLAAFGAHLVGSAEAKDMRPPWFAPCKSGEVSESQYPWQYCRSRSYMPPWITSRRLIGPLPGTWISFPDWRSVVWDGDDKGSALHRRTQAHSFAIENKLERLHDWSHPSLHPDYEFRYHEPPPKFKD
jgi:hypothetical protein